MRVPDVKAWLRQARRLVLRTQAIAYRSIVVPLLEREETEHALDLACRLAADRGARVVLVAPLVVECELPLDAHFDGTLDSLKERLESAAALAFSYGVGVRREIVRTRPGNLGEDVARVAAERRAELVVVGAPVESRRGFHRAFPREVLLLARDAPCRVMIATGPVAGTGAGGPGGTVLAAGMRRTSRPTGATEDAAAGVAGRRAKRGVAALQRGSAA